MCLYVSDAQVCEKGVGEGVGRGGRCWKDREGGSGGGGVGRGVGVIKVFTLICTACCGWVSFTRVSLLFIF